MQKKQQTVVVGIWGVHSGAGVTTLAVALANYMQGFLHRRVAVYEYNGAGDFAKIYDIICNQSKHDMCGTEGRFTYKKIDYYMKKSTDIVSLLNSDYDIVIVDCGNGTGNLKEFMRCDHKIVMSSLQMWCYARYEQFCERLPDYSGSDAWLHVVSGDAAYMKKIGKTYGITVMKRPIIDDAYIINMPIIEFFQTLFA